MDKWMVGLILLLAENICWLLFTCTAVYLFSCWAPTSVFIKNMGSNNGSSEFDGYNLFKNCADISSRDECVKQILTLSPMYQLLLVYGLVKLFTSPTLVLMINNYLKWKRFFRDESVTAWKAMATLNVLTDLCDGYFLFNVFNMGDVKSLIGCIDFKGMVDSAYAYLCLIVYYTYLFAAFLGVLTIISDFCFRIYTVLYSAYQIIYLIYAVIHINRDILDGNFPNEGDHLPNEDDDILNEDDDLLNDNVEILNDDDELLNDDDELLNEDNELLNEDDELLNDDDELLHDDDDLLSEDDDSTDENEQE